MLLVVTYNKRYQVVWQIIDKDGKVLHDNLSREQGLELYKQLQETNDGKENKDIPSD